MGLSRMASRPVLGLWRGLAIGATAALCAAAIAAAQPPASTSTPAGAAPADPTPTNSVTPGLPATHAAAGKFVPAKSPAARDLLRQRDQELDSLRAEQHKAAEAERKLAIENDAIAAERRTLNQSLIDTAGRIRLAEERVADAEARLHQFEAREAELRASLDGRRAVIAEVLAALQRIGHRPPPAVFASAGDAIEQVRAAMALGAVLPQLRAETEKVLSDLSGLADVKNDKVAERALLGTQLEELAAAQKTMSALIEERQKRQAEVELAIGAERQRALALSRQADTLKELIAKLEQGLDATSRAARAHPGEDAAAGDAPAGLAVLHDPARLAPAIAFAAAKGKLSLPVNGIKLRAFGTPDGLGGTEKGISIATRPGAQVSAPSDGWVVYAAPYRSYGQLLILNVGGGYHVVLAGMERITVDLGQFVLTGEPVGVMGNGTQVASLSQAGPSSFMGSSQPVLYVEFRKDGTPVDSSPWWTATENEKVRG